MKRCRALLGTTRCCFDSPHSTPHSFEPLTAQELGRLGGSAKSKRKAKSSRKNGKKGGRPAKKTTNRDGQSRRIVVLRLSQEKR